MRPCTITVHGKESAPNILCLDSSLNVCHHQRFHTNYILLCGRKCFLF
nr:MAG TPA: hypothetical protein [Caudoviricetes sp.]